MTKKLTVKELLDLKGKRQILITTAHDYYTAKACEEAGIDNIVTWGMLPKGTVWDPAMVIEVVRKGAPNTLLTASIKLGVGNISDSEAIKASYQLMEYGADMIYASALEPERVKELAKQRIPCVGHVGLIPNFKTWFGGLRAVGRKSEEAVEIYKDALKYQEAGAVAIEMECVPYKVATEITKRVDILTLSMGSGSGCDGQYLYSCDILGTHNDHYPRHSKCYSNFFHESILSLRRFKEEVNVGEFPAKKNIIDIDDEEFEKFMKKIR